MAPAATAQPIAAAQLAAQTAAQIAAQLATRGSFARIAASARDDATLSGGSPVRLVRAPAGLSWARAVFTNVRSAR